MESRSVKVIGGAPELDAFQAWILEHPGRPSRTDVEARGRRKPLSGRQAAEQAEADA